MLKAVLTHGRVGAASVFNMQYEAIPNWPRAYEKKKEGLTANIQFFKAEHLQEAWQVTRAEASKQWNTLNCHDVTATSVLAEVDWRTLLVSLWDSHFNACRSSKFGHGKRSAECEPSLAKVNKVSRGKKSGGSESTELVTWQHPWVATLSQVC
jgi:hypothetical protein